MSKAQQFEFKAEMKQLLHLIIHSLYTNPEVFLRELISNSSDALNKVRYRQITGEELQSPKLELGIKIKVDEKKGTFEIEDSGIGMSFEDLNERLGTIASSGTMEFIKHLQENKKTLDGNMIGQFGVGFYSAFMVTDQITVETRHADPSQSGWKWVSDGQGTYRINELDRGVRGTRISFKLKEDHTEFAQEYRIKSLIRKYSNFVDYPIEVNGEQVNSSGAVWHKRKAEVTDEERSEFYKFLSNDHEEPLGHLHLDLEGRVNFKAMLFVPRKAKRDFYRNAEFSSLHLYSNKVFVQDDCKDLLPEYLRFVEGVVDSQDLPLNVSREVTQHSPAMTKIREVLVNKILGLLEGWAKKDPATFRTFYAEFGPLFKSGLNSDFANRDRLLDLLRFRSTWEERPTTADAAAESAEGAGEAAEGGAADAKKTDSEGDALVSLQTYSERMQDGQTEIYYLSGENLKELRRDPRLELFRKKGVEVLLLDDPVDAFVVPAIGNYKDKPLKSIESADIDLKDDTPEAEETKLAGEPLEELLKVFRETAGDRIEDVVASKRLVESAVTLTVGASGLDSQMERMMKMMDPGMSTGPSKRVLEVNAGHPVIRNLSAMLQGGQREQVVSMARQLYEGALLLQGELESPAEFVQRMTRLMETATSRS